MSRIPNTGCYWYRWVRVWEWEGRSAAPHGGPGRAHPGSWGTERSRYTQSWRLPAPGRSPVWPPGRPAPAPHKTLINYRYLNTTIFQQGFGSGSALFLEAWSRSAIERKSGSWSAFKSIQELRGSKWSCGGPWTPKMEAWRVCRPVAANSHHLNEEQDPDANPHWSEKLDPDPH